MSCNAMCIKSVKMIWPVKQCVKNVFPNNKKIFCCRGFNNLPKFPSLAEISHRHVKSTSLPKDHPKRTYLGLKKHPALRLREELYHSNQSTNDEGKSKATETTETVGATEPKQTKVSLYQKLKQMYKEYWYVLVPVHLVTSSFWFGGFYYLAASGIDIPALLESFGAPESWIENLKNSKAGNIVLAYTLYKVATPFRYTITLGGTTISINYLKKWGWIKPVPNKEQIKKMYEQRKGVLKDFKSSCHDKMQVTKDEFLKTKKEMQQQYVEAAEEIHKTVKESKTEFKESIKSTADELKLLGRFCINRIQNLFFSKK